MSRVVSIFIAAMLIAGCAHLDHYNQVPEVVNNTSGPGLQLTTHWIKNYRKSVELYLQINNSYPEAVDLSKAQFTVSVNDQPGILERSEFEGATIGAGDGRVGELTFSFRPKIDLKGELSVTIDQIKDVKGQALPPLQLIFKMTSH